MLEGFDRGRRWAVLALLLACHVYFLQVYPHFVSPNELSRLLLTSAIVDHGSLMIDQAIQRYGDSQDKATFNGHYYSDKAIGTSLMGIPGLILMRIVERLATIQFSAQTAIFWLRLFTVTIPALLFLHVLTAFWTRLKPESKHVPHFVFLYAFGTIVFTYTNQFISHHLLGITLFCSAFYLNEYRLHPERPVQYIVKAGILSGVALLLEFPAVVPVGVLCITALYILRDFKKVACFIFPVLCCASMILLYNYLIFGTPWDVTYRHMTHSFHISKHDEGVVGMGIPKLEALHGLLFSRHHGLFFLSPFLLLSIPGLYRMNRSEKWSFLSNLFIAMILAIVLTYSAFSYWIAGWNFGPRYITPVIPFLITAAFYYSDEFFKKGLLRKAFFASIAIWSVLCVTVGTITFPFPPEGLKDPVFFLNFPLLFHNASGENLGGNPWLFFVLLLCTWLVMTFPAGEKEIDKRKIIDVITAFGFTTLLFVIAFFSRPEPLAIEYLARGHVYIYLGRYNYAQLEMQKALAANPDSNVRALIEKRIADLNRLTK